MTVPFTISSWKTKQYTQLFIVCTTLLPRSYILLGKPWFWEKELLIEDEVNGIVYDHMFPKAPEDRKHPCFQLKNFLKPQSAYAKARDRNDGTVKQPLVGK